MKIGQLAKLCGVSVATVRYYVSMGMLIPNDSSAQYDFSEREVEDLNLILKMRKHQFKLKEIQQYLILTRHSRMIEPSTINAALTILETKQQEIFSEKFLPGDRGGNPQSPGKGNSREACDGGAGECPASFCVSVLRGIVKYRGCGDQERIHHFRKTRVFRSWEWNV